MNTTLTQQVEKPAFNRNDATYFLDYLGHSNYWLQTFKPKINDTPQDGVIADKIITDKSAVLNQLERDNGRGIPCIRINEGTGRTIPCVTKLKTIVFDFDVHKERKQGYVSTEADHKHILGKLNEAINFFKHKFGFKINLAVDSGNGMNLYGSVNIHVNFDTKEEWENSNTYKKICYMEQKAAQHFNNDVMAVDSISKDINRRMKVPGVINKKDTEQTEDRLSKIIYKAEPCAKENTLTFERMVVPTKEEQTAETSAKKKPDRTRSAKEYWALVKLILAGYPKHGCFDKMGLYAKWCESSDAYKEHQYKNAAKKAEQQKEKAEQTETLSKVVTEIHSATNWLDFADKFVKKFGVYFDEHRIWWFWDDKKFCWQMVDETDILNKVDASLHNQPATVQKSIQAQIVEALRRRSRLHRPKEPKKTWIQFKDKIVDYMTGEIFDSTPEYFFTNPIPWKLGETEDTSVLDKIFTEWMEEPKTQEELDKLSEEKKKARDAKTKKRVNHLYEILAYCLAPEYFIQDVVALIGSGANGKTIFSKIIEKFVGARNRCSASLDAMTTGRPFETSKLYRKLVCLMGETNCTTIKKTELLKKLVGGDTIHFEFKHKKGFDDETYAKLIMPTNSLPMTEDRTRGYWRRWDYVFFPNEFPPKEDTFGRMPDKEFNNLAKKSIEILKKLKQQRAFTDEQTIDEKRDTYEKLSNPLNSFIEEACVRHHDYKMPLFVFHDEYGVYLDKNNHRKQSKHEVKKSLLEEGYEVEMDNYERPDKTMTKWAFVYGLRLKNGLEKW